ncbi:AraC-like protein [Curtobacterium sp. PhB130]|uniref:helix-turn-helix transcriptional regulator n=1 Tax=unclassified Curtobacterium TaxID=257496 RepID=UPI000F4CC611|nr:MULTISPECIES: AraC family transcriptional regulator [unclassified Curtobacterium]ROS76022.1 AraC-like protein [Curtobacterium sp. PhB130]TCK64281.1 AraC-like protein [Curtobacterium sp. PhB136]
MVLPTDSRPPATAVSATPVSPIDAADRPDRRWSKRLAGTDVDQALAFFSAGYELRSPNVRRTSPRSAWSFAGVGDERMSLRTARFDVDIRSESRADAEFMVIWLRSGTSTLTYGGQSVDLQAGVPLVLPIDDTWDLHHRDISLNMVQLDRSFLSSLAGEDDFAFEPMQRASGDGLRAWQHAVRSHSATWLDMDHVLGDVERRVVAESFGTAALRAFPRRTLWRASVPGTGPEHARLRRALEFVHAHANEPIGTPEIAAAAGLSPRGLQQSLRRHLDQTPGDLLRQVRLDGAHADLRHADRDEVSVAEIARSWGFGHLGRFSAAYRSRFGELPSESLRARS